MHSAPDYDSYGLGFFDALNKGSKEFLVEILTWASMLRDFVRGNGSLKADLLLIVLFGAGLVLSVYLFVNQKVHSQYFSFVIIALIIAFAATVAHATMPRSTRDPGVEYAPRN